ncbi:MAG: hypothetical protein WBL25_07040 [Anaerolineales bacterium]
MEEAGGGEENLRARLQLQNAETETESIRNYQAEKLGRYGGNTLLCELMPISKPNV